MKTLIQADEDTHEILASRLGRTLLRQRLYEQARNTAELTLQDRGLLAMQKYVSLEALATWGTRLTFTHGWGRKSFLDIQVVENELRHQRVPQEFDGYRILHLSDLHLDIDPALAPEIIRRLTPLEYDLALITGDYRNATRYGYAEAVSEVRQILPALQKPVYAILGNHDFIEIVPLLEASGLRFLLNEAIEIQGRDASFWVGGIDDPHFYKTHDLVKVRDIIPEEAFSILMSHSPETYQEVAAHGFDVMLSGHTHGGQICLPGGFAPVQVCDIPRALLKGPWEFESLVGYTSPGTGSCSVPLRFFCPPEIVIHTLRRAS